MAMISLALCTAALYGGDAERLEELERICAFVPCDDLRVQEIIPMPHDIIQKYHITTNQLVADLKSIVTKYNRKDVDKSGRSVRALAVSGLGRYCGTNELPFLAAVMTNSNDYAQSNAIGASINILKHTPELIALARGIITNQTVYSNSMRGWTSSLLLGMCQEGRSSMYIYDPAQHARIAAFFVEQAGTNRDLAITMDKNACELNTWYRHSQQRRDNLAALRPPGLTGKPAELYDAAQADAAQGE